MDCFDGPYLNSSWFRWNLLALDSATAVCRTQVGVLVSCNLFFMSEGHLSWLSPNLKQRKHLCKYVALSFLMFFDAAILLIEAHLVIEAHLPIEAQQTLV